jgi:signal transduction histidine kinase/CHASE3 domain sensor protein/DNA-binding response OmpR family regulator
MNLLSNRLVLLAAIPLVLFMGFEAYLSARFAIEERAEQEWVIHTHKVIENLQGVLTAVEEAEAGQRGYIITRQDRFLAPYRAGLEDARREVAAFGAATADNADQQSRAKSLKSLVEERARILDRTLASSSAAVAPTAEMLAAMEQGKVRMDALRAELGRAVGEENRLLSSRMNARRLAERNEIASAGVLTLVALFLMFGAAFLLLRSYARLRKSEAELENESAVLQTTIDTIRDGIAMFQSDGRLRVFSGNFFDLFGYPKTPAFRNASISQFREFDSARGLTILPEAMPLPAEGMSEPKHVAISGRELEVYRATVPGMGLLIVGSDVTLRVQAERVARQAQKMEAIGQLTGGVAHDFNNILQIISANLDRVLRDKANEGENPVRIQSALGAAFNGAQLTARLLAFARRQPLDPRSINIGRVVQDMTDLLRRTLGEAIEVECIVAGGLWNALIDPGQIENAILNLAINARDAMPNGGKLTIEVANAFLDDAYAAEHFEVASGQYVMTAVSDTGCGMTVDTLARAFEPFFTTKADGRGTGLGLSQIYGFVKQSGGHIKIYSEPGHGTTVKLYLPRTRKPQETNAPASMEFVEGRGERILVVEDDEAVRNAVVDMVGDLGYVVLKADNAEQALVILGSGVAIDLLFTDVIMPGPIATRELARRAQELHPDIRVLYTSGYTQNAIIHNGKLDDDAFLLSKPYRREELARKLRSLLDTKKSAVSVAAGNTGQISGRKKILVVEDVALIRMTTVDMLEEIGCDTSEASSGEDALEILRNDLEISVLLTDLGLPGMSGQQLIAEVLKIRPDIKILVASGSEIENGAIPPKTMMLMKPFDIEQLRKALVG